MKERNIFCDTNIGSWMKECGEKVMDPRDVLKNTKKDTGEYLRFLPVSTDWSIQFLIFRIKGSIGYNFSSSRKGGRTKKRSSVGFTGSLTKSKGRLCGTPKDDGT